MKIDGVTQHCYCSAGLVTVGPYLTRGIMQGRWGVAWLVEVFWGFCVQAILLLRKDNGILLSQGLIGDQERVENYR